MEFEEGLKKLNEILSKIESDEITIDESIKLYEESVTLSKNCMEILSNAEGKISVIRKELDKIIEKPLDDEE